jgi:hypothetical protein
MIVESKMKYYQGPMEIISGTYPSGQIYLQGAVVGTGEPIATLTSNVPDVDIPAAHIVVKDYSENEGVYKTLLEAGVIEECVDKIPSGFIELLVCPLAI